MEIRESTSSQSESIAKLAAALVKVQSELQPVKKDTENPFFHSMYADLGAVIDASRPLLTKNGLALTQLPGRSRLTHEATDEDGRVVHYGVVTLVTKLLHESGEWIEVTSEIPCRFGDPQRAMAAWTYLRRGAMQAVVGIAAEDDDDGNAAAKGTQASQERRSAPEAGTGTPEPFTGTCPIHNRAWKHNVGATAAGKPYDFWACPHFDEVDGKRVYCKEKPPPSEDQSILDNEPAGTGPEGDPGTVDLLTAISDKLGEMGKKTKAAKMLVFHKWGDGQYLDPIPATWEKLSAAELVEFADWLDAQTE